ncbi:MAG TPA: hypothetical protein VFR84_14360 [Candidatus Angelobacter sp.]|nr:hypothetical protein [Candidatus Angelobacter sp.]
MRIHHPGVSLVAFILVALAGCGGKSSTVCKINSITVSPATATVNHAAAPPGNTQQFAAFIASEPSGCAFILSNLPNATWSVSDPINVSIANPPDPAFGTATCKAATAGPVTVTATVPAGDGANVTNTASLTCN